MIALVALFLAAWQQAPVFTPPGAHPYAVSSASMEPTLQEGDVVLADRPRGDCGVTDFQPGDVVIVMQGGTPYVRRVVATAGQSVQMIGGSLHVDGVALKRERQPEAARNDIPGSVVAIWRETLANGRSYLIQDLLPGQAGDDTPALVVPDGRLFALGDNRDNALDDRFRGPAAVSDLCGVVTKVVRSPSPARVGTRP